MTTQLELWRRLLEMAPREQSCLYPISREQEAVLAQEWTFNRCPPLIDVFDPHDIVQLANQTHLLLSLSARPSTIMYQYC